MDLDIGRLGQQNERHGPTTPSRPRVFSIAVRIAAMTLVGSGVAQRERRSRRPGNVERQSPIGRETRRGARSVPMAARIALVVVLMLGMLPLSAAGAGARPPVRTPVVLFPAYHFAKLAVTVRDQGVDPACPTSGTFEDWFQNDQPGTAFSQVCRDELLTLRYDADKDQPMAKRFSDPRGVSVALLDYGRTQSAPFYEAMYRTLEAQGYVRNVNIRVAGYDARLTPDMGGFLPRTKKLIETTYEISGDTPVHLVGHSNGPLYAQYLLTHTSEAWKEKYIHGFTPIAGNFPGQGSLYSLVFTGLNIQDFSFPATKENALSSARLLLSAPSTYMSAADPRIFGRRETVVTDASTGRAYTPRDFRRLFRDAAVPRGVEIAEHYIGFVKFARASSFPHVDVYAEKGSGIPTMVGAVLPDLTVGQVISPVTGNFITRDGDVNQEDLTNNAVLAWQAMRCFRFSLTDNPGVDHFSLPSNPAVLVRLVANLARPRSDCG